MISNQLALILFISNSYDFLLSETENTCKLAITCFFNIITKITTKAYNVLFSQLTDRLKNTNTLG